MSRSFDILLGEPGADFRQKNLDGEIERNTVIERGEDLFIGCELLPVVHGQYETTSNPDSDPDASLVIFDLSFQPNKRAKRFVSAQISVVFSDEQHAGAEYDPVVKEMSFFPAGLGGYFLLFPTTRLQQVKRTTDLSGGGGAFGATLTAGYSYGRQSGAKNAAEWALNENTPLHEAVDFRNLGVHSWCVD